MGYSVVIVFIVFDVSSLAWQLLISSFSSLYNSGTLFPGCRVREEDLLLPPLLFYGGTSNTGNNPIIITFRNLTKYYSTGKNSIFSRY